MVPPSCTERHPPCNPAPPVGGVPVLVRTGIVVVALLTLPFPLIGALAETNLASTMDRTIVSSVVVSPVASSLSTPLSGGETTAPGPLPGDSPFQRFLERMGSAEEPSPEDVVGWVHAFFWESLHPDVSPFSPDAINESATSAFTYLLGDIDGDGIDDFGFDTFCTDEDVCTFPPDPLQDPEGALHPICGTPHWFEARSGKDGDTLWKERLDTPHPVPGIRNPSSGRPMLSCSMETVYGVIPEDGLNHVLVYRWQIVFVPGASVLHHDIYLLDAKGKEDHGHVKWIVKEEGLTALRSARNYFVLPILQVPDRAGLPLWPAGTRPSVILRGVGWDLNMMLPIPRVAFVWEYQPNEWAAGIEPLTGAERWRAVTFTPPIERSLLPSSYGQVGISRGSCCFDLNGDLEPELFFTTLEWGQIPYPHVTGPEGWASHTFVFDGKSGKQLYVVENANNDPSSGLITLVFPLGDVTGDGAADFFHEQITFNMTHAGWTDIRVLGRTYNGPDGKLLWTIDNSMALGILPLGNVDAAPGNDVFIGYYVLGSDPRTGLTNVTNVRLATHSGATGAVAWETTTFTAPLDLLTMLGNTWVNGVFDLNGDNSGDVWVDHPEQKDDLTLVHHLTFLSGRDGSALYEVPAVGAFAFPIYAGDLNGDGGDDFTITQGDAVDLWITAHDGRTAQPFWARRILEIPVADVALAFPRLKYHSAELDGNATEQDLLLSFRIDVTTSGLRLVYQQHQALQETHGHLLWAVPGLEEGDDSLLLGQLTPATVQYLGLNTQTPAPVTHQSFTVPLATGGVLLGGAAWVGLGVLLSRRRGRA